MAFNPKDPRITPLIEWANVESFKELPPARFMDWCRQRRIVTTTSPVWSLFGEGEPEARWRYCVQRFNDKLRYKGDGKLESACVILEHPGEADLARFHRDCEERGEVVHDAYRPENGRVFSDFLSSSRDAAQAFLGLILDGKDPGYWMLQGFGPPTSRAVLVWEQDPESGRMLPTLKEGIDVTFESFLVTIFAMRAMADPTVVTELVCCQECGEFGYAKRRGAQFCCDKHGRVHSNRIQRHKNKAQ